MIRGDRSYRISNTVVDVVQYESETAASMQLKERTLTINYAQNNNRNKLTGVR